MRFTCPNGCLNKDGTPQVHPSRRFCKYEVEYRRKNGKWLEHGSAIAPNEPPAPEKPTIAPTPEAKPQLAKAGGKGISIGYRPATVVGPGVELANQQVSLDWEVSEATCERFWGTVLSGIEQVLDFACEVFFQIPKVPPEVFQLDDGQKYVIRTTFRGVTTNILQKVFRAKTPEQADKIVAGIGGIVGFGMMALKIVWHFVRELPKSPRLAKLKAKFEEAKAKRAEEKAARRLAAGDARTEDMVAPSLAGVVPG